MRSWAAGRHARALVAAGPLALTLVLVAGCPGPGQGRRPLDSTARLRLGGPPGPGPAEDDHKPDGAPQAASAPRVLELDRVVAFQLPGGPGGAAGADVALGARTWVRDAEGDAARGPGMVIVPGGGDVSRDGVRRGDGVVLYSKPVAVTAGLARGFAARGATVLAYDKRTCGPNADSSCGRNPTADLDRDGPVALAADVDAACAALRAEPTFDGRLILVAHGQGGQVALRSACANEATAIVLLAPIPRRIDVVLVDALRDRTVRTEQAARAASGDEKARLLDQAAALRNLAGSKEAGFASMSSGKFAAAARVDGATIAFWLGWMALTEQTEALMQPHARKLVVVTGKGDLQYAASDRARVKALPAASVVEVEADHHLLSQEQLVPDVLNAIGTALDALLAQAQS